MQVHPSIRVACAEPISDALELTILMPCLNERATVAGCVAKAQNFLALEGVAAKS